MTTERMTFAGHDGSELAARLDLAEGTPIATALFAHCFTCGKDIAAARRIAGRLATMGFNVLRFDFTGLGHSGGEFSNTTFSSNAADLVAASKALTARGMKVDVLIGHSLGGAAVLKAARDISTARAVVTLGAPYDPEHVSHNFGDALADIARDGTATVNLGGRPIQIGREFVEDIRAENLRDAIGSLHKALLVMHAPKDQIVGVENASQIFLAAKHPKSFVTLDEADHLISRADDAEYAADVISSWVARYLDLPEPAAPIGAPEGIVRVAEADSKGFLQHISAGPRHQTIADEPTTYGGTDKGMTPYGFLSAGLGACTSMTIRMYARRKRWPLTHVYVDVTHNKVHAQDAETGNAKVDTFTREIHLEGDLSAEQRDKLLEIADKCPVHKTLEQSSIVKTVLGT